MGHHCICVRPRLIARQHLTSPYGTRILPSLLIRMDVIFGLHVLALHLDNLIIASVYLVINT